MLSGVVVFLVALPLCLGIALASGAPLFAGIISGVVGGLVVSLLSKSQLSVTGPAAGLVVIVLGAIETLGSYEAFLTAIVLAGILQFFLGQMKAGIVGMYFPSSIIKGMLAAIGLILILKQIPHLVGFDSDAFGEMEFIQKDGSNTISSLFASFEHLVPGSVTVGLFSLLLLILWERPFIKQNKLLKHVPSGLLVVVCGIAINQFFKFSGSDLVINSSHMVNIPVIEGLDSLSTVFRGPDLGVLSNVNVYITAATLAIVASLETLLSIEAIDKLDPQKRRTPHNAELKAQGIGNVICGLIGGLPVTAVIVRGSANIDAGARTKKSAFIHGMLLLIFVAFLPQVINEIPLASLAAILVMVGFKLTKPALYRQQFGLGREQFIPFIVTIIAILFTDLLIGILIGMGVGVFYILRANYRVAYHYEEKEQDGQPQIHLRLSEHVSFLNKVGLQLSLDYLPENSQVIIDGSQSRQIDHDALELIHNFKKTALERNINFTLKNVPELFPGVILK